MLQINSVEGVKGDTGMQGVKKRCRLSWLTNSALVYEPNCEGRGWGCGVSANEYNCAHGAQINFGELTPCLTYAEMEPGEFTRKKVFVKLNRSFVYRTFY